MIARVTSDTTIRTARAHSPLAWEAATGELYRRLGTAVIVFCVLLAGLIGAGIAVNGDWRSMDTAILLSVRAATGGVDAAPEWLTYLARDLTALGGVTVLSTLVFAVAGYLALRGHKRTMIALLAITVSGWMLSHTLKIVVARPRPELVPQGMTETTASFPSGHALVSMIVFVTLASMLARIEPDARVRAYLVAVGLAISVAIGTTRVFLGVHWPTDVLGGWILGLLWIMGGMRVLDGVVRRHPPAAVS